MVSITELANKYGTDKGTQNSLGLAYSIVYDALFCSLKEKHVAIAEIGLQCGGPELGHSKDRATTDMPSVKVWTEYFPDSHVWGLDISDFSQFNSSQFTYVNVDCGNTESLKRAAAQLPPIDIFVDDGSHASRHQQLALIHMITKVKPGGYYIIEDLHWQPDEIEANYPSSVTTSNMLLRRTDLGLDDIGVQFLNAMSSLDCVGVYSKAGLSSLRKDYNTINRIPMHWWDTREERSVRHYASGLYKALTGKPHKFPPHYVYLAVFRKPGHLSG